MSEVGDSAGGQDGEDAGAQQGNLLVAQRGEIESLIPLTGGSLCQSGDDDLAQAVNLKRNKSIGASHGRICDRY